MKRQRHSLEAQPLGDPDRLGHAEVGGPAGLKQDDVSRIGGLDRADQAIGQRSGMGGGARSRLVHGPAVVALQLAVESLGQEVIGLVDDLVAKHVGVAPVVARDRLPHSRELPLQVGAHVVGPEMVQRPLNRRNLVAVSPARREADRPTGAAGRPRRSAFAIPRRRAHGVGERRTPEILVHVDHDPDSRPGKERDDPVGSRQIGPHGRRVVGIRPAERGKRRAAPMGAAVARVVGADSSPTWLEPFPDDPQAHRVEAEARERAGVRGGEPAGWVAGRGREYVGQPRPLCRADTRRAGGVGRPRTAPTLGHQVDPVELQPPPEGVGQVRASPGLHDPRTRPPRAGTRCPGGARQRCQQGDHAD
jgi:hypothetical protein